MTTCLLSSSQAHEVECNLVLLQRMLDNHAIDNMVNEATYIQVIKIWANDVRSRSRSPSQSGSLEIGQLSSSDAEPEVCCTLKTISWSCTP